MRRDARTRAPLLPAGLVRARAAERTGARPFPRLVELGLLVFFAVVAVYAALLPLAPDSGMMPPDLLYCLVIAWTLRSPKPLPVLLVAGIGLFADLMLSRPMGLGALGLVLASEFMRRRSGRLVGAPFPLEWIAAIVVFALMLAGEQVLLHLVFAVPAGLHDLIGHLVGTAIAYPVAVLALVWGLGLRAGTRTA